MNASLAVMALFLFCVPGALGQEVDIGPSLAAQPPDESGNSVIQPGLKPKVIGGVPADFREAVKIAFAGPNGGAALCTGIAIAADRVLTAGHCGCAGANSYKVSVIAAEDAGSNPATEHVLTRPPVLHRGYSCAHSALPQPGRDAAILYLAPPIQNLAPAPAAAMLSVFSDEKPAVIVAGYGRTITGAFPGGMLMAETKVLDYFCVRGQVRGSICAPFREFVLSGLVTSIAAGADTCDGDSGGPVYWLFPGRDLQGAARLRRFLIGITSRGLAGVPQFGATGCGGGGVYTTVGSVEFLGWLAANGAPLEAGPGARHFAQDELSAK
jgi:Trypsin